MIASAHFDRFYILRDEAARKIGGGAYEEALRNLCSAAASAQKERMPPFYVDPVSDDILLKIAGELRKELPKKKPGNNGHKIKIAHIIPFLCDHLSITSIFLSFLLFHDREHFEVRGYTTETLEDQQWGKGRGGYSAALGKKAIQQIQATGSPLHFLQADSPLLDRVKELYLQILKDNIDVAVIHVVPWDLVSLLTGLLNPARFVYAHLSHFALNLVPYHFDYHLDFTLFDEKRCSPHIQKGRQLTITSFGADTFVLEAATAAPYSRKELGLDESALLMGTFGSLHKLSPFSDPGSNNYVFFKTIKKIMDQDPRIHYFLAGANPGIDLEEVLSQTVGHPSMQRVRYLGMRKDIPRLLKSLDLYLNSFPLGGGCSVREAMAAGTPVVTLNERWDEEYRIPNSFVGFEEAIASTPEEFALKASRLLASQEAGKKLGAKLQERLQTVFHPRKAIEELERFLLEKLPLQHPGLSP